MSYQTKKNFYINSILENISNSDYNTEQKFWITFEMKNLEDYHDLHVQSNTLILTVFFLFFFFCIKTCNLDPTSFYSVPQISLVGTLNMTKHQLELRIIGRHRYVADCRKKKWKRHFVINYLHMQELIKDISRITIKKLFHRI